MKKILLLLACVLTFAYSEAQTAGAITLYKATVSSSGYTASTTTSDTVPAAATRYWITEPNAMKQLKTGRYKIAVNCSPYEGTYSLTLVIQGRCSTSSTDSAWVNINQVRGTDGRNTDTLTATSASTATNHVFNVGNNYVRTDQIAGAITTTLNNQMWTVGGHFAQIRVVVLPTTKGVRVHDVRLLPQE